MKHEIEFYRISTWHIDIKMEGPAPPYQYWKGFDLAKLWELGGDLS
jgi:hypothetical protein